MSFALFLDGRQIGKPHTTRVAVAIEAFECGAVERGSQDFLTDPASFEGLALAEGYDIRAVGGSTAPAARSQAAPCRRDDINEIGG